MEYKLSLMKIKIMFTLLHKKNMWKKIQRFKVSQPNKWSLENVSVVDNFQEEVSLIMDHILQKNPLFLSQLKTPMATRNLAQYRTTISII